MPAGPNPVPPVGRRSTDAITAPDGSQIRLVLHSEHGAHACSIVEVSIGPGSVSRPVRHRAVEEAWYIIAGTGRVWRCPPNTDPGSCSPVAVTPGDAVVIPVGWAFQFSADLHEELRFLCITMPPWPGAEEAIDVEIGGLGVPTLSPP